MFSVDYPINLSAHNTLYTCAHNWNGNYTLSQPGFPHDYGLHLFQIFPQKTWIFDQAFDVDDGHDVHGDLSHGYEHESEVFLGETSS